jgi:FAD:protein FMN transferase
MATRFEIVLHGDNLVALRAAGEEALDEIDRLESRLSLYRAGSDVALVNRDAHRRAVRVTPEVFGVLTRARALWEQTSGAFDITVAPLVKCWGFMNGTGASPDPVALEAARQCVGMQHVELHTSTCSVRFARPGVMIDLGAIGKGYAVDRAALLLREAGVTSALIHGGTSTAFAIGTQPNSEPWRIAITAPEASPSTEPLCTVLLHDESLSVSAVWGRSFSAGGKTYGHIMDPRTGAPAEHALLSAVVTPSATDSDALSTALLTAPELFDSYARLPSLGCLVLRSEGVFPQLRVHGLKTFESPQRAT